MWLLRPSGSEPLFSDTALERSTELTEKKFWTFFEPGTQSGPDTSKHTKSKLAGRTAHCHQRWHAWVFAPATPRSSWVMCGIHRITGMTITGALRSAETQLLHLSLLLGKASLRKPRFFRVRARVPGLPAWARPSRPFPGSGGRTGDRMRLRLYLCSGFSHSSPAYTLCLLQSRPFFQSAFSNAFNVQCTGGRQ